MMEPIQTYLGVPAGSNPFALLGLPLRPCSSAQVEAALLRRLEQVFAHPRGRDEDAAMVRATLRRAANELRAPEDQQRHLAALGIEIRRPKPVAPSIGELHRRLTLFDKKVLAVLIGEGGWNARSRSKLIALANEHQVTPKGLLRIVQGLSRFGRSRRLDPREFLDRAERVAETLDGPRLRGGGVGQAINERLTAEFRGDTPWARFKLSLLFGAITIGAGIVLAKVLLGPGDPTPAPVPDDPGAVVVVDDPPTDPTTTVIPSTAGVHVFRHAPTFLGEARPREATDAADHAIELLDQFDEVARRIAVSDDPSEAVYRLWQDAVATIAQGWVLVDESTRQEIDGAVLNVLYAAAGSPTVSDRLLRDLVPPSSRPDTSLGVWIGAWKAGELAVIARTTALPPSIVDRASSHLRFAVPQDFEAHPGFQHGVQLWLDVLARRLVDVVESQEDRYDYWEMWLSAQNRSGNRARAERATVNAIGHMLRLGVDLSRPGPTANVLGRLLSSIDLEEGSGVRQLLLDLVVDETIDSHSMWVFTSLLARYDTAPWYEDELVVPPDADWIMRRRLRDRIAKIWPQPPAPAFDEEAALGRGVIVDAGLGQRWIELHDAVLGRAMGNQANTLMRDLVDASRLNEAAALLAAQRLAAAEAVIELLERSLGGAAASSRSGSTPGGPISSPRTPPNIPGGVPPGQAIGTDGAWADRYEAAGRSRDDRLTLLGELRGSAGTDLGPADASRLVREAYRGAPREVRDAAVAMVVELFLNGPNVAMEMLDQLPDVPAGARTAELIERYVGSILPPANDDEWRSTARRALVRRALMLRRTGRDSVDDDLPRLVRSVSARAAAIRSDRDGILPPDHPHEAAQLLVEAWQQRASILLMADPVPDDLPGLERRRRSREGLAIGPIQRFVALQITVLDHLAYVTVAEQPGLRAPVMQRLGDSSEQRARLANVLQQAVQVESTIAGVWRLRLTIDEEGSS